LSVQIFKQGDKPEWAVVPYETYLELVEKAEMLFDIQDYDSEKAALARGDDELVPSEVVYAILDGENAIKVWRKFRGMSQLGLAEKVGISVPYLSKVETNKRTGSLEVLCSHILFVISWDEWVAAQHDDSQPYPPHDEADSEQEGSGLEGRNHREDAGYPEHQAEIAQRSGQHP
jgi:transcriptional regulator with XRE-family HTH domain